MEFLHTIRHHLVQCSVPGDDGDDDCDGDDDDVGNDFLWTVIVLVLSVSLLAQLCMRHPVPYPTFREVSRLPVCT